MITIITTQGIVELPHIPADDPQTINGMCQHNVSLFAMCGHCWVLEELERIGELEPE